MDARDAGLMPGGSLVDDEKRGQHITPSHRIPSSKWLFSRRTNRTMCPAFPELDVLQWEMLRGASQCCIIWGFTRPANVGFHDPERPL